MVPLDIRKPKVDHKLYQRLLRGDAAKKAVVDLAVADLQWGPPGLPVHPILA